MQFDLVVIGSGVGGASSVHAGLRRNLRVGVVRLAGVVDGFAIARTRELKEATAGGPKELNPSASRLRARANFPSFLKAAVDRATPLEGEVRLLGRGALSIDGTKVAARRIVIATGSTLRFPSIVGLDQVEFLNENSAIWRLIDNDLGRSVAIIGGSPIACELAFAAALNGVNVTLLCEEAKFLPGFQPEVVAILESSMESLGITLRVGVGVRSVRSALSGAEITTEDGSVYSCDDLVVPGGRVPDLRGIDVEYVGVVLDSEGFVRVDEKLQTTVSTIFAVGDVTGKATTTQAAEEMGRIAVSHAFDRSPVVRFNPELVPVSLLTVPEVASVGVDCKSGVRGRNTTKRVDLSELGFDTSEQPPSGYVKLTARSRPLFRRLGGGVLIGAQVVGDGASEAIAEAALVIRNKMVVGSLAQNSHVRPSIGLGLQRAAQRFFDDTV